MLLGCYWLALGQNVLKRTQFTLSLAILGWKGDKNAIFTQYMVSRKVFSHFKIISWQGLFKSTKTRVQLRSKFLAMVWIQSILDK